MIVTADWVLPVTARPIRGGAVLTRGARIEMVGTFEQVFAAAPDEPVERYDGCALMPGLVNAHTHLSLTVLGGLVPPTTMQPFLRRVTAAVHAMGDDDFAASASQGALESLRCGVTTVGDIAYGPEPLAACADIGVGGVFFWEVLGIEAHDLSGELAEIEFPAEVGACTTGRTRCGITPHAPYTSGPALLDAAWRVAQRHKVAFAIHVAESPAERELMLSGRGPLAAVAARTAHGFSAPGVSSVAYLEKLGVLRDALAVHCVNLEEGDARRLKKTARGVVLCPRSNAYLSNGEPPVAALATEGVRIALGTDSPASNHDLDLWEEARALRELDPTLTPRMLIAMLTREGAYVLGLEQSCGALAPGMQADLAIYRTGEATDPEADLVRGAGAGSTVAVMTAGVWRVRDGKPALPTLLIERASADARATVERALARA